MIDLWKNKDHRSLLSLILNDRLHKLKYSLLFLVEFNYKILLIKAPMYIFIFISQAVRNKGGNSMAPNTYITQFYSDELYFHHSVISTPKKDMFKSHSHANYELLFFVCGAAKFVSESNSFNLKKNDLILIPSNKYHRIVFNEQEAEYERFSLAFSSAFAKQIRFSLGCPSKTVRLVRIKDSTILVSLFNKLDFYCKQFSENEPEKFLDVSSAILKELFYFIKTRENEIEEQKNNFSPLLISVLNYIDEHLFEIKHVTEINQAHYISYPYLIKLFKNQFNTTPKKYLMEKRLIEAQRMIAKGALPTHIYDQCGFENYNVFYRSYQSYFGHTPSQFKTNASLKSNFLL